jgi:hypothetical protein
LQFLLVRSDENVERSARQAFLRQRGYEEWSGKSGRRYYSRRGKNPSRQLSYQSQPTLLALLIGMLSVAALTVMLLRA